MRVWEKLMYNRLLRAIAEHDPEYDFALEQRWRKALDHTTSYFIKHY